MASTASASSLQLGAPAWAEPSPTGSSQRSSLKLLLCQGDYTAVHPAETDCRDQKCGGITTLMPASGLDQYMLWLLFSILQLQHFIKLEPSWPMPQNVRCAISGLRIMYVKIFILGCGFLYYLEVQQNGKSPALGLLHAIPALFPVGQRCRIWICIYILTVQKTHMFNVFCTWCCINVLKTMILA